MDDKEIGGYFDLELYHGKEYYSSAIKLNSGRNALRYLIRQYHIKKIWVPYYTCPIIHQVLEEEGCRVCFYHVAENLMPDVKFGNDFCLYTNYFGVCNANVRLLKNCKNLILDNAQAFFCTSDVFASFNSPRKFFGVSDGSYLLCDTEKSLSIGQDYSSGRFSHLLKRLEYPASDGFGDFRRNEEVISTLPLKYMSRITEKVLSGISYDYVKKRRLENFNFLHENFFKINDLYLDIEDDIPMVYPLLIKQENLREKLISSKIYIAKYWPDIEKYPLNSFEKKLQTNLLALPIDQRYTIDDMRKIVRVINESC